MTLKCISLWQPWATLMAIGAKRIETRHWDTNVRGLVAIHAAKRWSVEQRRIANSAPFQWPLYNAGLYRDDLDRGMNCSELVLPFGAIIAVGELVNCKMIVSSWPPRDGDTVFRDTRMLPPSEPEFSFGDYERGRYGWSFENVRPIEPIPCTGRQGWFSVKVNECE